MPCRTGQAERANPIRLAADTDEMRAKGVYGMMRRANAPGLHKILGTLIMGIVVCAAFACKPAAERQPMEAAGIYHGTADGAAAGRELLPPDFPADVPLHEVLDIVAAQHTSQGARINLICRAEALPQDFVEQYGELCAAEGWTERIRMVDAGVQNVGFIKGDRELNLTISIDTSGATVNLLVDLPPESPATEGAAPG
jgi:hypothetical protein